MPFFRFLTGLLVFTAATQANAATRYWPDLASPCDTTLQACITGANAADTVMVRTSATIDLSGAPYLYVNKPLSLLAAPGFRPTMPNGTVISAFADPGVGVNWSVSIEGFTVPDGGVVVSATSGNATVSLRRLDVVTTNAISNTGSGIAIRNNGSGALKFEIAENRVRVNVSTVSQPPGIYIDDFGGGSINGSIHDNRITSTANGVYGIYLFGGGPASSAAIYSNQISGNIGAGIAVSGANGSTLDAQVISNSVSCSGNSGSGLTAGIYQGSQNAQFFNNTVVGCNVGLGISSGYAVSGRLSGNLIAYNHIGVSIPVLPSFSNDHNLLFANSANTAAFVPDPSTVTADPLLRRGAADARLSAGSPAIDGADSSALRALLTGPAPPLPEIDADGLRRFKGVTSLADIGAFEYGDTSIALRHVSSSNTLVNSPALTGNAAARPLLTHTRMADSYQAASNGYYAGFSYAASNYYVSNELSGVLFSPDSAFNVFVPAPGAGTLLHTSNNDFSTGNVFGFGTRIANAYFDNQGGRIVLATHRVSNYFNEPLATSFGFGSWYLWRTSAAGDFPNALNFDVYAQDASLDAFHWSITEGGSTSYTVLDNLAINGESCAQIFVQQGFNTYNAHPLQLRYVSALQRWRIENVDTAIMANYTDFYVLVDEAATA
ncbi:MAG: choice-of-anchor Q domain-containing protein, partial [Dokdonella sp.]